MNKPISTNNSSPISDRGPLVDKLGRVHTSLRISITDRCNIRCFYCMPAGDVPFKQRSELLTFEEITRFVQIASTFGVTKIRLTGGEPLVRHGVPSLIKQLYQIPGIEEIALTTNGMLLLPDIAQELLDAGLTRINISLDTLNEEVFEKLSRRTGLQKVLDGIAVAKQVGFKKIRLNAIALRGFTEPEIIPLAKFAREQNLELRFIEFMPLDAEGSWEEAKVLTGVVIRQTIENEFGPLVAIKREDASQPATDFEYADNPVRVGFIMPVSEPFCVQCNRLRLTAEGQIRNCLFSNDEWDARALLRSETPDEKIALAIRNCIGAKKAGMGTDDLSFLKSDRAMYQIGG